MSRHLRSEESALESTGRALGQALETIVLRVGRPVLDVKEGQVELKIEEAESQIWKGRLERASDRLKPGIRAVGRIEVENHPRASWLGTGWLVQNDVVVTNRHVAELFVRGDGARFRFRTGLDDRIMRPAIDFVEEFDSDEPHEVPFYDYNVIHVEGDSGPDLAFLRVEPVDGRPLPKPVELSLVPAVENDQVAVVGYPARDPYFPDQELMNRIFKGRYNKKRLAPGLVTGATSHRLHHDCSTLGGNSGGEVVALDSGQAVALHFAGTLFETNHAVPAELVGNRLEDALSGRIRRTERSQPIATPSSLRLTAKTARGAPVLQATVPVRVRIELGEPEVERDDFDRRLGVGPPSAGPAGPPGEPDSFDDYDSDELEEARPEDYLDRVGYRTSFLGEDIPVELPEVTSDAGDVLTYVFDGKQREVLPYRHFSVLMSESRRLCRYSACNIDGAKSKKKKRKGWRFDPRIPKAAQIRGECYGNPPLFSRGHMTRREDPVWGADADASTGNTDSMHVTNAVPQMQPFNAGIWLSLEDYALDHTREDDMRISVFTGPFLTSGDPTRFGVQIPVAFWKIIAFVHDETGELSATGYVMSQEDFLGGQEFVFAQHRSAQRPIREIEQRAGLDFGPLAEVDPLAGQEEAPPVDLVSPSQIRFVR